MPKHVRTPSTSHRSYGGPMPVSLAPSPMYTQQRMTIPSNYYGVPSTTSSMTLQTQPSYDSYAASAVAAASGQHHQQQQQQQHQPVSVPPPAPVVQHRASSGAWTPTDDQQLLNARMQGLNWGQIQANFFPAKTPNACRKRHERLMERKGADDWDNQKLQRLAKEYMAMRKEIWSGLAARTGEKWNVVEQKVSCNAVCVRVTKLTILSACPTVSRTFKAPPGPPPAATASSRAVLSQGMTTTAASPAWA